MATEVTFRNLKTIFHDNEDDVITLMTIIDEICEKLVAQKSSKDSAEFLDRLHHELGEKPELTGELSWDLPKCLTKLLVFAEVDEKLDERKTTITGKISSCFELINLYSNPKECLLTYCDMISTLSTAEIKKQLSKLDTIDDSIYSDEYVPNEIDESHVEFIFNFQLHLLLKSLSEILQKIQTNFMSKFLSMTVTSMLKLMSSPGNFCSDQQLSRMVLSPIGPLITIYTFISNYAIQQNLLTASTEEEQEKVEEKELQQKLLRTLLVSSLTGMFKNSDFSCDILFASNSVANFKHDEKISKIRRHIINYDNLAQNLGFNFQQHFKTFLHESEHIYETLTQDKSEEVSDNSKKISEVIYQLSYTYELKKLSESETIQFYPLSILSYATFNYLSTGEPILPRLSLSEVIYSYIRCSTASLQSEYFNSPLAEATCRFLLVVALSSNSISVMRKLLQEILTSLKNVFLQLFLIKSCQKTDTLIRGSSFQIMAQILSQISENESFDFIIDTLLMCPYNDPKIIILDILKSLFLRDQNAFASTSKNSESSSDSIKNQMNTKSAPTLPHRPVILIKEDRIASIHSLYGICFEKTLQNPDDRSLTKLYQSYLNLIIVLRNKWDKNLLKIVSQDVKTHFSTMPVKPENPEIGFIQISGTVLANYLSQNKE